jgi:hypothetical protein
MSKMEVAARPALGFLTLLLGYLVFLAFEAFNFSADAGSVTFI